MFRDHCFERSFFSKRSRIFRAQYIEVGFGASFVELPGLEQVAKLANLFSDAAHALGYGLEFECELPALSAESLDLRVRIADLRFEAACFAIGTRETLLGLRQLIAQTRGGRNVIEDGDARLFLLPFDGSKTRRGGRCILLAESEVALRGSHVGSRRFQNLTVRFPFGFERGQTMSCLRQFCLG